MYGLVPIQMHRQSELDSVSFGKTARFQGSHFVCVGEGGLLVVVVCGGGSVGLLMRLEWRFLGVGRGVLVWGWVCV